MKKSSLLTVWILIGTILAALGLLLMMNLFNREKKAIEKSGDECFSELISYQNVMYLKDLKLKFCQIKIKNLGLAELKKIKLNDNEVKFKNNVKLDEESVKIDKIIAEDFLNCYRKVGAGNFNIMSKVQNLLDREKNTCLICTKLKFEDDIVNYLKNKGYFELRDLRFLDYLESIPSYLVHGSLLDELQNTPTGNIKFYLEENLNLKFKTKEFYFLVVFSKEYVIPQMIPSNELNSVCKWIMNLEITSEE
ncbi:MAG: hypothetical protein QXS41_03680 [Candidatus Woesearchaeota archaeon]